MVDSREHGFEIGHYGRDDAMIAATRTDGRARMAVYAWQKMAAVLGRGGNPAIELNLDAVRTDGLPVLRRHGGGCAVLLDPGNIIVSVTMPLPGIGDIKRAFAAVSDWVIAGLARSGIPGVETMGVSDLVLDGRKIGGSCVYRARDLFYYSTTLLVSPDLDAVERYIVHPPREPEYRAGRIHRDFMGSLSKNAIDVSQAEITAAMKKVLNPSDIG